MSGPALHEALGWRYGAAALLWRSLRLHWRDGTQPALVAPVLATLWDLGPLPVHRGGAATPQAWTSAHQRRVLLIEGWDGEEEGSGGHCVGVTHDGTVRCLSRRNRPLTTPPDLYAATGAMLASIPSVYAEWYAVLPAPGSPPLPPQHQYPRTGDDATERAWLAARELVRAWRQRRRVQVAFRAP